MRVIESNIVKVSKYNEVQEFHKEKDIMKDINESLLQHFKNGLPLKSNDEFIVRDHNSDQFWTKYKFKAYMLTEEEYERLTNK